MTGMSHLLVGAGNVTLISLISGEKDPKIIVSSIAIGTLAAILPDVDAQNSLLQHHLFAYGNSRLSNQFISRRFRRSISGSLVYAVVSITEIIVRTFLYIPVLFLKLFVTHRGITHTIIAAVLGSTIIGLLAFIFHGSLLLSLAFWMGYLTHLVLDSMTVTGIMPLLPFSSEKFFLLPGKYRLKTGSTKELVWVGGWALVWLILIGFLTVLTRFN